ncbi:MAG: efflux RND transporter periplasmic adaptor subunit, partial [Pirellulaceae bacterium]
SVWDEYADQYPVRAVGAIPLPARSGGVRAGASDSPLGMLFCERFAEREYGPAERRVLEQLARQAAVAWNRVDEMEQWPLATLSRWLRAGGWVHGTRVRWTSALLIPIVAAVAGVILLAPADFDVRAEGTLQPMERREVYAPAAGVVQEIHVRGGQQVAAGDVLVTLRSAELESELARLAGELQTARRQYQSVQAARRQAVLPGGEARFQAGQLAAEEERLKELMRGLELQHGHRVAQREELTIRSPLAGQVLTWEVDRLLRARPLRPGQRLMTIAQVDGPWVLELRLADADVGHVMAARHEASAPLPVSFRATNNPSRAQRARVTSIAEWTDSQDSAGPSLQATATLDEPVAAGSHPGTSVVARIHLGQRARGFVWFRDLWEFVRLRLWF